jgi:predicted nucleic acid-binding protein
MPTYYFLDSSALVKHYHPEDGTAEVDRILNEVDAHHIIARLTVVEAQSALVRKMRMGELSEPAFDLACQRLREDIAQLRLRVLRMTEWHYQTAEHLLHKYAPRQGKQQPRVRTLDALQLAVALDRRNRGQLNWFVCADDNLCQAAQEEQLSVLNPSRSAEP